MSVLPTDISEYRYTPATAQGQEAIVNAISSASGTIVLGTFQATNDGTGYSTGDLLVYRQTPPASPAYLNTATGLDVIPNGADLGPVGGASSAVTVTSGTVTVSSGSVSVSGGEITANAGADLNTSELALESGGNLAAIAVSSEAIDGKIDLLALESGGNLSAIATAAESIDGKVDLSALATTSKQIDIEAELTSLNTSANEISARVGAADATAATSDTGTFPLISLIKRSLVRLSNLVSVTCTGLSVGGTADNAAISGAIAAPGIGKAIFIKSLIFSYGTAPSSARVVTLTSSGNDLVNFAVTSAGAGFVTIGVQAPTNTAIAYSFAAGGTSGVIGRFRIYYSIVDV
jgi:hypothetical protein